MSNLPAGNKNFEVIQSVGRITHAALAKLDGLIIITPHKIPARLWRQVPGGSAFRTIGKSSGAGELIYTRSPNPRATDVWLQKLPGTSLPVITR